MAYRCIVCGVTGSEKAQKAALEAAKVAKEQGARLVYVYAVDSTFLEGGATGQFSRARVEESLEHLAGHILDHVEELARTVGMTCKKVVRRGEVLKVLQDVIREEEADLLMVGHEERTFLEKFIVKGEVEEHLGELKARTGIDVTVVR